MFKQEKQLRVFAKSLMDAEQIYLGQGGVVEDQIKIAVKECMYQIGDRLEEILNMDDEQLMQEKHNPIPKD